MPFQIVVPLLYIVNGIIVQRHKGAWCFETVCQFNTSSMEFMMYFHIIECIICMQIYHLDLVVYAKFSILHPLGIKRDNSDTIVIL